MGHGDNSTANRGCVVFPGEQIVIQVAELRHTRKPDQLRNNGAEGLMIVLGHARRPVPSRSGIDPHSIDHTQRASATTNGALSLQPQRPRSEVSRIARSEHEPFDKRQQFSDWSMDRPVAFYSLSAHRWRLSLTSHFRPKILRIEQIDRHHRAVEFSIAAAAAAT